MEIKTLTLLEKKHPNGYSEDLFNSLIGIDEQKQKLLGALHLIFEKEIVKNWTKKHHPKGIPFLDGLLNKSLPLIILSGEVGCGKTALANSIGTPLATKINKKVICLETPSDIRGSGRVGEISNRISSAFAEARRVSKQNQATILIVDEADDLATSRSQNQAHHEDRAGLNVLVKQLDLIVREKGNMAVVFITNRLGVLDPAVIRRASLILKFDRPNQKQQEEVFKHILQGTNYEKTSLDRLLKIANSQKIRYTYSDLIHRVAAHTLRSCILASEPFSIDKLVVSLQEIKPSPLIKGED